MVLLEQFGFYTFPLVYFFLLSAFEAEHKELTDCLVCKIQQRILIIKRRHMKSPKSRSWTPCLFFQMTVKVQSHVWFPMGKDSFWKGRFSFGEGKTEQWIPGCAEEKVAHICMPSSLLRSSLLKSVLSGVLSYWLVSLWHLYDFTILFIILFSSLALHQHRGGKQSYLLSEVF